MDEKSNSSQINLKEAMKYDPLVGNRNIKGDR